MLLFLHSAHDILTKKRVYLLAGSISALYLSLTILLFNKSLVEQTVLGPYSLLYKGTVIFQLFTGYWAAFPLKETLFTLATGILIGVNLSLIVYSYRRLRTLGGTKLSFGGTSLLAVVATGCPGCGITLLSFLGPSTAPAALFLHDWKIQLLILLFLTGSILYNLRKLHRGLYCVIPNDHAPKKTLRAK